MIPHGARAAAIALAVAVLAPGPARSDPLADAEGGIGRVQDLLAAVDETAHRPDESLADRAGQKFYSGETHYLLGDWERAGILMGEALDDPTFRAGPQGATATFYLGDALRHAASCGAAHSYLSSYIQGGELAHRGEALTAALDCAIRLEHPDEVAAHLAELNRYYQGQLSPEVRYLAAKALRARTDVPPEDRFREADAAFAAVAPPFAGQAAYQQAVLRLERSDLAGAAERLAACAALPTVDARQREVQDLCTMGLARVRAETGDLSGAISAYDKVAIDSPFFDEALYEAASTHGRAGEIKPALQATETVLEVEPDSPLASQAMLLQGTLLLKQGSFEAASQVYGRVIETYGPVRDQLDTILTLQEDPVRYFADILGRKERPSDVAASIPVPAMRLALARPELARASALMQDLEAEARDVEQNQAMADRISAALARGGGVDAFPRLREAWSGVQAVENAVAVLQGDAQSAAVEAAEGAMEPGPQAELAQVHAERLVLETRLDALPRTTDAVKKRLDRWRVRIDELDRQTFGLGYVVDAERASITATESWMERHRGEIAADQAQREGVAAELRKHREILAGYEQELKGLRQEIALTRDAAAGSETLDEEARLRSEYLALLARERALLDGVRARLSGAAASRVERAFAVADRLAEVGARARALEDWIAGEARRRAEPIRAQLVAEQTAQNQEAAALAQVQTEARGEVGQLAYRSFEAVRQEFFHLVLRADVGLNDVAWTRKKDRVDRIQKLSVQQVEELKALDKRYQPALKEEE